MNPLDGDLHEFLDSGGLVITLYLFRKYKI